LTPLVPVHAVGVRNDVEWHLRASALCRYHSFIFSPGQKVDLGEHVSIESPH
jgi:hypothetical protein